LSERINPFASENDVGNQEDSLPQLYRELEQTRRKGEFLLELIQIAEQTKGQLKIDE